MIVLYDITSLYVNIVLDSLIHHGIGPTTLVSVSDPGFHFYKNNPDSSGPQFIWSKVETESPELFVVDALEMKEVFPFAVPIGNSYANRGKYQITFSHLESISQNTLNTTAAMPRYAKVSRHMRSWFWSIPSKSLKDSLQALETVLWRESHGTSRDHFEQLLGDVRTQMEKFRYEHHHLNILNDAVVLSGIPRETLEVYYDSKKQKIIKSTLDKVSETWYKHYSKKIKNNHF
tara:strand:+ start:343 stop:1038 length:696 start_codon:yes stop_codon:yes gene_type:complete